MSELKPCPICYKEAYYYEDDENYPFQNTIMCVSCTLMTDGYKTKKEAYSAWNTRQPNPEIEQLKAELARYQSFEQAKFAIVEYYKREIDRLRKENAELKARLESSWISVEDRLPDNNSVVVIWCTQYGQFPFVCLYDDNEWDMATLSPGNIDPSKITHWLPLPEPPRDAIINPSI